ncbi:MAG: biopolymer transporter ExbD [Kiritimatiellaeota bacterium]|nr:biopolymer transporter ExbD [Kiritimatiellota bacterium]
MAKKRLKDELIEEFEMPMGPMIDCMMLLLMYFIIAGQIKTQEKYLGLLIPGGGSPSPGIPVELVMAINVAGQVSCNGQPLDAPADRELPTVRAKIKQCLSLFGDRQPVIIHPQPKVRQQRIIDVLNACAAVGVKNLSFNAN